METLVCHSLQDIPAEHWNALAGTTNPFLRYEFLLALEQHNCLEPWGWFPCHILLQDRASLLGAMPLYLKHNSYGEFVFDWAWADAFQRAGLAYFPKLVSAVPYTPVTGSRLLIAPGADRVQAGRLLVKAALSHLQDNQYSSLHVLFPSGPEFGALEDLGLMQRNDVQFHWENDGYASFDDFLAALRSKRRKMIRRERRLAMESGAVIEIHDGHSAAAEHWEAMYHFYASTFDRKSGHATLTLNFFKALGAALPDSVVLVLVKRDDRYIAGAFNMRDDKTLYGRHWGCTESIPGLHFEVCYYQLIEYCIRQGLDRYEAGAQGEHKILRGFLPNKTRSAHWIADAGFRAAVGDFLHRERRAIDDYIKTLAEHSPFRDPAA